MIYNKIYETLNSDDIKQLQIERLQSTLNRVYRNVAFYKNSFDQAKINIEKIKTVDDIKELPFTTKEDLRNSYPYDLYAVPLRDIVRMHSTSGTTGIPVITGYTKNDLRNWTECICRLLVSADITEHDVVQIAFNYSLFTGGFGFHQGAEHIGASVIPASSHTNIETQIKIMRDFKSTVLACTPGFAIHLDSSLREMGIHPEKLFLRVGLFGAEPWTEEIREKIESELHITALDTYGLTEIMGPGIAFECQAKEGMHLQEDHFIAEIIDQNTLQPLPTGEQGELVITTITREGFPLIRYRTGDITSIVDGKCSCGRTTSRIHRITGRTDNLIFFNEQKFFPSMIEKIIQDIADITPHFLIYLTRENGMDEMEIQIEMSELIPRMDEIKIIEGLMDKIARTIENQLGILPKITFVEKNTIQKELSNKSTPFKVIDRRI